MKIHEILGNIWQGVKKRLVLIFLCMSIVFGLTFVMFTHYTSGNGDSDFIYRLESALLDFKFKLRGVEKPKAKVGILAVDEQSIRQFGRWPFSRVHYKQAFSNLKKRGAKWISFDIVYSEKEVARVDDAQGSLADLAKKLRPNRDDVKKALENIEQLKQISPGDQAFGEGVSEFENIILGYFYFKNKHELEFLDQKDHFPQLHAMADISQIFATILPDERELNSYPDGMKAFGLVPNIPSITESASHFAFFSNEADIDAIIRWVTLVRIMDGVLMPSISLKSAAEYLDREIMVIFGDGGIESIDLVSREDESDSFSIPIDSLGRGRILINHKGPGQTFQHISFADAYNDDFTDEEAEFLKDSLLMLGPTAIGINDQRPNPFDPTIDGVEVHATAVENILSQQFLSRPSNIYTVELLLVLLLGLFFAPLMIYSSAALSGVLVLTFLFGYYYFDKLYWFDKGVWAYIGMPYIEILSLFVVTTLYKYIVEEREKRKVKGAFAHYLSPDVIDQVLDDPDALQLGGVRDDLTVFFSDVRGFTTISEGLSPEQLCVFMNEYFTPMTGIILESQGVLDKYIGDAIMAFWGAPIPLADQADRAAKASVEMLYALDKVQTDFKAKNFPDCDIGIGLNTGAMSVGNMGSDERFCYTVMGDAVNLGARLEGLTKEYGVKILISEFTVAKLTKGMHFYRDLDDIIVKGKNEPIRVYQLMRPDMLANEGQMQEMIQMFEQGRRHYGAQEWQLPQKIFEDCLKMLPEDGPSLLYKKRVEAYAKQSPGENWDGVFTFTHK